ncbi:MAG: hypothetical protein ABR981_00210 [Candidatus Micrarchaeaceae archaeon]|jgi:hypothetical protein
MLASAEPKQIPVPPRLAINGLWIRESQTVQKQARIHHKTKITGYKHTMAGRPASYILLGKESGACGIRIKMSRKQFEEINKLIKQEMESRAAKYDTPVDAEVNHNMMGYGQFEYYVYKLEFNEQMQNELIAIGKKINKMLQL